MADMSNSVIGGNHDLTLDTDWYLQNGEAWHRGGLEVLLFFNFYLLLPWA